MVVFRDQETMELQAKISIEPKKVENEKLLWINILKNWEKNLVGMVYKIVCLL